MLTKEEAMEDVDNEVPMYSYEAKVIVSDIYESRGTCSTCIEIGELKLFCRHWYMLTEPDGYCHHFQKGEPK